MNFDKLNINYELILSEISKNGLKTHPPPCLRNIKIHIIGASPWLRDKKIMAPTHTTMAPYDAHFPPEHAGIKIVMLRRKITELWRI